jgi:signal peptidase I
LITVAKKDSEEVKDDIEEKPRETPIEFLASLAAVLVTGLFIITFVVQAFEIPSSSMEDTLLIGDHVFVNRIQFAPKTSWVGPLLPYREVRRGDIVVFLHPDPHDAGIYVVKRIIGVPGDRIHLRNGVVYRNGEALIEPYVLHDADNPNESYRNNLWSLSQLDRRPGFARGGRRPGGASRALFCHGGSPGRELGQPLLGIYSAGKCDRASDVHLLVV